MTQPDMEELIRRRVGESLLVKEELLAGDQVQVLVQIGRVLVDAYRRGNKAILFGNGGSAADAQHIAAELVGRYYLERAPLPAIALTVNTSSLTAIGNDYSFDLVFARQLEAVAAPGDVAIGISTSGNAENVLQAVRLARAKGVITVGLSGRHGGRLRDAVDYCLCVPSEDTPRIQECHILIGHLLCEIVEQALCGQA